MKTKLSVVGGLLVAGLLAGCAMPTQPISSEKGGGSAESAEQAGLYETSASPAATFNAAKVASSRLAMATIATADPDIGLIQVKRGAAKTINILVKPGANHGKTTVKIDVANMAGIWALFDPNTDTSDIVSAMKDVLGVPVTLASQNKASAPEKADHTPAVEEVRASAAPKAAATQPAKVVADKVQAEPGKKEGGRMSVLELQKLLLSLGYPCGLADGAMGRKTVEAVRKFQKDHDLPVTGYADHITEAKLRELAML